jgi:hypothetical protein
MYLCWIVPRVCCRVMTSVAMNGLIFVNKQIVDNRIVNELLTTNEGMTNEGIDVLRCFEASFSTDFVPK